MIETIVPGAVACTETFEDAPDVWLFPEEEAVVASAVAKRRRAFGTGRASARSALARLGVAPARQVLTAVTVLAPDRGSDQDPPPWSSWSRDARSRSAITARSSRSAPIRDSVSSSRPTS